MGLFKKIAQLFGQTEVEEPTSLESIDADEQGKKEEEAELNHHLEQIVILPMSWRTRSGNTSL